MYVDVADEMISLSYEQCYRIWEDIGFPWILDDVFGVTNDVWDMGCGEGAFTSMLNAWMYQSDSWADSPSSDWIAYDERLVPTVPRMPTDPEVRDYLSGEIREMIDQLWETYSNIDFGLEEIWMEEDDSQKDDLLQLIDDVQTYGDYLFSSI